jgi:hypothetical protein
MPTVFKSHGFIFRFYSNEGFEPCHIHVVGHGGEAKFWIPSCQMVWNYNLKASELRKVLATLYKRRQEIQEAWNVHFNR